MIKNYFKTALRNLLRNKAFFYYQYIGTNRWYGSAVLIS